MNTQPRPIPLENDWFKETGKKALLGMLALVSGASLVYVVSAALLLAGVQRLLPDFQIHDGDFWQKLSPVGAIHAYEIAVLAVLGLVAIWKRVYDDAISLSMLSALFMIAGAATLNMFPHEAYALALAMGACGVVLAGVKIAFFWPWVVGRLQYLVMAGLGLVITSSFLIPGVLARQIDSGMVNSQMLPFWTIGWWVWLAGAALIVGGSLATPKGAWREGDRDKPFLQTSAMRWIMVAIILVASAVHQQGVIWVIALPLDWADLLLAGSAAWLLWMDVRRVYERRWVAMDYLPGIGLLGTIFYVVADQSYHAGWDTWGILSYPPMVAILTGLGLTGLALRAGRQGANILATLFVAMGALLWGNSADLRIHIEHENLMAFYGVLAAATAVGAIANRSYSLGGIAWCLVGLEARELVLSLPMEAVLRAFSAETWFLTTGTGMMLIAIVGGRRSPAGLAWLGSLLAYGGVHWVLRFGGMPLWHGPIWLALGVGLIGLIMAWRTGRYGTAIPPAIGVAWVVFDAMARTASHVNPGWLLVTAGFAMLGIGAAISFWRASRRDVLAAT